MRHLTRASYTTDELSVIHSMAIDLAEEGNSLKDIAEIISTKLHRTTSAIRQQMYLLGVGKSFKGYKPKSKLVKYAEYQTKEGETFVIFKKIGSGNTRSTDNSYSSRRKKSVSRGRRVFVRT